MVERSNKFFELMNGRRTLRFFSDEKLPKPVIENIIRTAGTAPSGGLALAWSRFGFNQNRALYKMWV